MKPLTLFLRRFLIALSVLTASVQAGTITEQIAQSGALSPAPVWVGEQAANATESNELLAILARFPQAPIYEELQQFVTAHPQSSWTPSLRAHVARMHREKGRYTLALREWEQAWAETKLLTNAPSRGVAEFVLAHWSQLLASLGRTGKLSELFQETASWQWQNSEYAGVFAQSRQGYETMLNYPGVSYRCGTFALTHVAQRLGNADVGISKLIDVASPSNGFSMSKLVELSDSNHVGLVAVRRPNGSEVVVPSVIHWRQNHYAAVLGKKGPAYWVADPTFGYPRWMHEDYLNEEASGTFLVPSTNVPTGWKLLARAETEKVFGKGQPSTIHDWADEGCDKSPGGAGSPTSNTANAGGNQAVCIPCAEFDRSKDITSPPDSSAADNIEGLGMPVWWVTEPYINLFVADEPLSYIQSDGKKWSFRWTYKQRDIITLPSKFAAGGVLLNRGSGMTNASWTHNFLSFIRFRDTFWDDVYANCNFGPPGYGDWEAYVYLPGGGIRRYSETTVATNDVVTTENRSQVRLQIVYGTSPPTFRMDYPDGSQDIYGISTAPACSPYYSDAVAYLTARVDPQGRTNSIVYETTTNPTGSRIKEVIDPEGRTNRFFYTNSTSSLLVTKIVDAFGHEAFFGYDGSGRLNALVDAANLSSSIVYSNDGQGWISQINTPYGSIGFKHYDALSTQSNTNQGNAGGHDRVNRYIIVADGRDGGREVYMYRYETSYMTNSYPTNEVPAVSGNTFDNGTATSSSPVGALRFRNSFHWGKKQMAEVVSQRTQQNVNLVDPTTFTATDYFFARTRHWHDALPSLISPATSSLISDQIALERAPSPDGNFLGPAATVNEGYKTWFDYYGKSSGSNHRIGTNALLQTVARVLPDGTTQFTSYDYSSGGHLTPFVRQTASTYTDANGGVSYRNHQYGYAANGIDLISHTFPGGPVERFAWDSSHHLIGFTNAEKEVTSFTYNGHRLASVTRPNNFSTTLTYSNDALAVTHQNYRRLSSIEEAQIGRAIYFPAWSNGLPQHVIADRGLEITNTWDPLNRLTGQQYSDGTFISNRYDRLDLSAMKDRSTNWTYFTHDGLRRLNSVTDANSNTTSYSYCGCGSLQSITDALGNATTMFYDSQERPWFTLLPDGTGIAFSHDKIGRTTLVADGVQSLSFTYNNQNLVTSVSNNLGEVRRNVYDERDRPVRVTSAAGVTVTNTFDSVSRLLTRVWPDGGVERFAYNANGLAFHTNSLTAVTRYVYDVAGRLSAITNANLDATRFAYNQWSDLTELIDGRNQTNKWGYDVFGRATNKVNASGQTVFGYSYDANDRLTNRWTPAKGNTRLGYDSVGNLLSVTYPNSPPLSYTYDALNRVKQMNDAVGASAFAYTTRGQLAIEDGPWGNDAVTNTYSRLLRTNLNVAGVFASTYAYDGRGRLTNLTSDLGTFSYQFLGASHLRKKLTFPNGANISDSYDHVAQLTNTTLRNSSAAILNAHSYSYDTLGQRDFNRFTDGSREEYAYDPAGQLKAAITYPTNGSFITRGYGYDTAGNVSFRTNDTEVRRFTTDKLNQLTNLALAGTLAVSGITTTNATNVTVNGVTATLDGNGNYSASVSVGAGTNALTAIGYELYGRRATNTLSIAATLQYDANGNMLFDGKRGFAYDDENQLTTIVQTNAWKSEFVYDGFGRRRIRKEYTWTNSAWNLTNEVRYVYDGMLAVMENDGTDNPQVFYQRGLDLSGGRQGAGGIGGLLARFDANGMDHYHTDANGNVTALIDASENLTAHYSYDPFGNVLVSSGPMAGVNEVQFSSMPRHAQSGLNLYTFRAYSPNLQRWTQRDPIGEWGGVNLHSFVANDPVDANDPFGLWEGNFNRPAGVITWNLTPSILPDGSPFPGSQHEADYNPGPRLSPDPIGAMVLDLVVSAMIPIPGLEEAAMLRASRLCKAAKGTGRSAAARAEYLKSLADDWKTPSWQKPWLEEGRVPPGYQVDHIKPLSIGGPDIPANMRLQGADLHRIHHGKGRYRPWDQ